MDYFFQEQRWTDTFLSLHVKKFKRIILFLLIAFSAAGAKAAGVPTSWKAVAFNENIRYSQWVINSRISDFYGNTTQRGFNTYDKDGKQTGSSKGNQAFDYVPGLVAKAILEAYANYSTFDWSKPWFYSVMNYAKEKTYKLVTTPEATDFSGITLDNMNACKMYFPLMKTGALSDGAKSTGETAITNVLTDMKKYNELYVIGNGSASGVKNSTNATVQSMFGGWFHKPSYKDQMWCDGLYMGAALLAQIVNYKNSTTNVDGTSDWDLITKQFTISWNQLYDSKKGLLYHAFTANPKDAASSAWAGISNTSGSEVYHSEAFWGRAMGWYFLALVDVLEQMPSNNSNRATLIGYLEQLAAGLAKYQDGTGCWYQVVDEKEEALTGNYLESSCTSLFAAAYLKAYRLGFLTSNGTYDYKTIGVNAFKGAVNQFMKYDTFEPTGTTVQLVHNCASAGLGGDKKRSGSREYYITGNDVGQTNTYTEGKVMGAFIMAATEYELANPKAIRFSYDLAPTYTLAKGGSIKAEALGSGTISYQWYKSDNSKVSGATSETFTPAESGLYYCKATSGNTTIQTSTTAVTVEAASNENGGTETSNLAINTQSNYKKNSNAWTPAVGGTISITDLVTSSSKGAYSITTGDAATLDGTSLTAVKDGTITLKQAADDNYKEGSIAITVRIGQDVTSNGSNAYSFTEATNVSDGMTIARKDITMTFGNDGFWSRPSADGYTGGQVNPKITENIPTAGTFYKFAPTKSGSLAVKVKLGATETEGNYKLRPLKVSENGTLINATLADGKTLIGIDQTPAYEKNSYQDNITFRVKANTDYYVYVPGSKLGFYNFTFSPDPTYTVTFNSGSNGTCTTTSISQSSQGESITLPDVTPADGYTFDGWYTDEALTSKVEGTTYTPTADITLYAKCSRITDLFKLSDVTSTKVSVDSKKTVDVTSKNATVTGGSAQLYNGHSSAKDMILNSQINLNGSSASYLKITLDNTLKAGDEIIINPATSSFKLSDKASNSDAVSFTGSYVIKEGDAVVGQKVIYLYKGSNSLITDINITRYYPESDSRATFTYNNAEIAFSEETAGDKTAYTTTLEIGASKKGQTITITPSTKVVGATIKQGESTVSGNISIIVPSEIGSTATSTYTVTSTDKTSTTTYEINVKLVKENVVLVYAQSDGKTEWTWDTSKNSTKPTFTQPTLKVYLANADGTPSKTEVKNVTGITYMSDVEDVATVDNSGTITIKNDANGGAKIYAILEGNEYYNDTLTYFNLIVKQGYSYSVADDATIANGPDLNQSVYIKNGQTNLVKMTFGGWKWNTFTDKNDNNKLKSTYVVNEKTRTDEWKNPITSDESVIASIDGYKTYISGATDAVDESKLPSDNVIYGFTRYGWFKPAEIRKSDSYLETYPYSLPVRGAYMTFEPTQNGKLTVYILQNGAWNTFDKETTTQDGKTYAQGDIKPGEFRPHSFYICNQRGLNVHQFSPKTFNCTTKQKVKGDYYCDLTNNQTDSKNIATWTEFSKYMSKGEQDSVAANWKSGINGAQKIVRLDNGSYLAIEKGIVKYTFFVTANETYYLFSNFSKLGFCGANFVPSETVKPANDDAHKINLSDVSAYPKPTKVTDDTDADKIKYAWKFGDAIKGYVPGFTIPLFKSIKLTRTFKKDQWTTLSLPFNLTQTEVEQIFGKGTQIIVFDKAEPTSARIYLTFFYHEIQNVLPGYPYLIRPTLVDADGKQMVTKSESADYAPTYTITKDGDKLTLTEFTVYNKAINPAIKPHEFKSGDYTAKCTPSYCTAGVNNTNYSMLYENGDIFVSEKDGTVYISEGNSYGKGYRSYIDYTGTTAPAKALSISFSGVEDDDDNGTTTDIRIAELADDVIETLGIGGVYNLNGQKVADTTRNLPAGIYIVNGRKVVVK